LQLPPWNERNDSGAGRARASFSLGGLAGEKTCKYGDWSKIRKNGGPGEGQLKERGLNRGRVAVGRGFIRGAEGYSELPVSRHHIEAGGGRDNPGDRF